LRQEFFFKKHGLTQKINMYKLLILIVCLGFWERASGQRGSGTRLTESECRIALVIGNSKYNGRTISPLTNPSNDADSIKSVLTRLKFEVLIRKDVSKAQLWDVLEQFKTQISQSKNQGKRVVALLYYAGHGVRWQNDEQLISIETSSFSDMMTAQFSPDGVYLAAAGNDSKVYVYRVDNFELEHLFVDHTDAIHQIRFSLDGQFFATASLDRTVHLYKMSDFSSVHTFSDHSDGVNAVSFSPNGRYLATGGRDKQVRLYRMSDKRLLHPFQQHTETIYTICFSADSKLIASAGEDKKVYLYNSDTRRHTQTLSENTDWIYQLCFSSKGRYLATASKDRTLRLYQRW
jgi:WD40 repeat protein